MSTTQTKSRVVARLIPQNLYARQALEELQESDVVQKHYKTLLRCQVPEGDNAAIPRAPTQLDDPDTLHDFWDNLEIHPDDDDDLTFSQSPSFEGGYGTIELVIDHVNTKQPGWMIGGGDNGIINNKLRMDALVVSSKYRVNMGVASFHAIIHFHKESGVLMLQAANNRNPIIYYLDNKPLKLFAGEKHVLFQQYNRFQLGKLEFLLQYEPMNETIYLNWASVRNVLLAAYGLPTPNDKIIAVPYNGDPDRMRHFILHEFLGTGSFGWVRACVDRRTGNSYALKQLALKSMRDREQCAREVDMMLEFKDFPGVLTLHEFLCEHGHTTCYKTPELFYLALPLAACGDLSSQNWSACNDHSFIASMLRGPLRGLQALHNRGFIHRDITMKNILIRSMSPPDAIIADFGKTIKATRASETMIGPIYSLPPEVNGKDYDNKIDIFSFGIACFRTIIPVAAFNRLEQASDFDKYFSALQKYAERSKTHSIFADLLQSMLSPEPTERPSASQALLHPFFDLCSTPPESESRHQNKGNIQCNDEPGKIAKHNSNESTSPFSAFT